MPGMYEWQWSDWLQEQYCRFLFCRFVKRNRLPGKVLWYRHSYNDSLHPDHSSSGCSFYFLIVFIIMQHGGISSTGDNGWKGNEQPFVLIQNQTTPSTWFSIIPLHTWSIMYEFRRVTSIACFQIINFCIFLIIKRRPLILEASHYAGLHRIPPERVLWNDALHCPPDRLPAVCEIRIDINTGFMVEEPDICRPSISIASSPEDFFNLTDIGGFLRQKLSIDPFCLFLIIMLQKTVVPLFASVCG